MSQFTRTVLDERKPNIGWDPEQYSSECTWPDKLRTVLVEGPDTVIVYKNELLKGRRESGKMWSRWREKEAYIFSMKKEYRGTPSLHVYRKTKGKGETGFWDVSKNPYTLNDINTAQVREAVIRLVSSKTGEDLTELRESTKNNIFFRLAFPNFQHWADKNVADTHGLPHMRSETIHEFTRELFGKTRYRKDLVKAVAQAGSPGILKNAHALRGLVPIDWIITYLRDTKDTGNYSHGRRVHFLRESVKKMSMAQRKSLMPVLTKMAQHARGNELEYLLEDSFDSMHILSEEEIHAIKLKPSEFRRFHDELAAAVRKKRYADKEITPTPLAEKIKEIEWNGIKVVPATSTHQVIDWGAKMNHCIGSYADGAVLHTNTLVGIYKDGSLIGNAMFAYKYPHAGRPQSSKYHDHCVQAFGKNNQYLPEEVQLALREGLKEYVSFENSWGIKTPRLEPIVDRRLVDAVPF